MSLDAEMSAKRAECLCAQVESMIYPIILDFLSATMLVHTLGKYLAYPKPSNFKGLKPAGSKPFKPLLPRGIDQSTIRTTPSDMMAAIINASAVLSLAVLSTYLFTILYRGDAMFLMHILAGVAFASVPGSVLYFFFRRREM